MVALQPSVTTSAAHLLSQGETSVLSDAPTLASTSPGGVERLEAGQLFAGRYFLLREVGRGGMGAVYQARDELLGEVVGLKVLEAGSAWGSVAWERFRREARLARRIAHRHVARVYDLGRHQGHAFLTMEYVDGEDLRARLARQRPLSAETAARVALAVCEGLAAAHAAGVVHRDLKPANVLLEHGGRVVVTDFGIARAMEDEGEGALTNPRTLVGTPLYMAPEQMMEEPVDARTDVYALGLLLWEMLVGEPAFQGCTTLGAAFKRLRRPPPDPRMREASVPDALAELVLACLSLKPHERPAGALAVADTLATWLAAVHRA
jgi:serine/threonine-protein kinase